MGLSLFDACVSCFAEENFTGILHTKIATQNDLGRSITRVVVPKKNKELSLSLPTLFIGRGRKPANENKKRGLSDLIKLR